MESFLFSRREARFLGTGRFSPCPTGVAFVPPRCLGRDGTCTPPAVQSAARGLSLRAQTSSATRQPGGVAARTGGQTDSGCQRLRNILRMFPWGKGDAGAAISPHRALPRMLTGLCAPQGPGPQPAVSGHPELGVPHHHAAAARGVPGHRRRLEHPARHLRGQIRGLPCDRCVVFVLEGLGGGAYRGVGFLAVALFTSQGQQERRSSCSGHRVDTKTRVKELLGMSFFQ